ncbi:MAG: EAL domain-containing protein [Acidimicrobiales bacterium]
MSADRIDALFGGWPRRHPLVVELSEQQLLGDPVELLPNLTRLRSHGVQISLDDVGFGRTSLETLLVVEPEIVKIDASFIRGVHADEARRRWLSRLVRVARSLGATLVAEGIEQSGEVEVVESLSIEWCQGFFFAEPELVD